MRTFKPYDLDQPYLLPPDLRSWLSEGHLALFVSDVVDALDLSPILDAYERGDGRGYPPYHPVMMLKLLVYGYCTGKISSRKIEKATWEDIAFRVLSGNQQPDHDSIAEFRRRHLKALASGRPQNGGRFRIHPRSVAPGAVKSRTDQNRLWKRATGPCSLAKFSTQRPLGRRNRLQEPVLGQVGLPRAVFQDPAARRRCWGLDRRSRAQEEGETARWLT